MTSLLLFKCTCKHFHFRVFIDFLGGSSIPQHRSDLDTREDIDRGLKRSRPRSPTESWAQNNNQVSVE